VAEQVTDQSNDPFSELGAPAVIVAGLLAADGEPVEALDDEDLLQAVRENLSLATFWMPGSFASVEFRDRFQSEARQPAAQWVPPDPDVVERHEARLEHAWGQVTEEMREPTWTAPSIRVGVHEAGHVELIEILNDRAELGVSAHVWRRGSPWRWQWPIRVGVLPGELSDQYEAQIRESDDRELTRFVEVQDWPNSPIDLLVVDWFDASDNLDALAGVQVSAAISIDSAMQGPKGLRRALDRAQVLELSGVIATTSRDVGWFDRFLVELSHDQPLDLAASLIPAELMVAGDPEFLAMTAPRNWIFGLLEAQPEDPLDKMQEVLYDANFEAESNGSRRTAIENEDLAATTGDMFDVSGRQPTAGAQAPPDDPLVLPSIDLPGPVSRPAPGFRLPGFRGPNYYPNRDPETGPGPRPTPSYSPRPAPAPTSSRENRRLRARVRDSNSTIRTYGFVRGKRHTVAVRIARPETEDEGSVTASTAFPEVSDEERELTVVVRARGTTEVGRRKLILPPSDDSKWTRGVGIVAPSSGDELCVHIDVLHQNRTIQSAILCGPLLDAPGDGDNLTLEVDRSSTPAADRQQADVALLVGQTEAGPFVFDPGRIRQVSAQGLKTTMDSIAATLRDAFETQPDSLPAARQHLVDLATQGSVFYSQIRAGDASLDSATWVHIGADSGADLPFELCYTHELPNVDAAICPPAANGEVGCADSCSHRQDATVVCPYGFWATSAVVERRIHSPDRDKQDSSTERTVAIGPRASVAISKRVNNQDRRAAGRIKRAVKGLAKKSKVAKTWSQLQTAASNQPSLVVLVVHSVPPPNPADPRGPKLEVNGDMLEVIRLNQSYINPQASSPGPAVLALGCDTDRIEAGLATLVGLLHNAHAELVLSAISPVSGQAVSHFVDSFMSSIGTRISTDTEVLFGQALTETRRQLMSQGNLTALALTSSGDADVKLTKGT